MRLSRLLFVNDCSPVDRPFLCLICGGGGDFELGFPKLIPIHLIGYVHLPLRDHSISGTKKNSVCNLKSEEE